MEKVRVKAQIVINLEMLCRPETTTEQILKRFYNKHVKLCNDPQLACDAIVKGKLKIVSYGKY